MSKNLTKLAYYPRNTSLHESLAAKVITRVVSDGISLRNAVREAIKIAELNKKDIFLLLSVLQDFGMVQNGDFKNYWSNGWGEGIGTEGIDVNQGTNYFASSNSKVVTAEKEMNELFEQIEKMRAFASDEEIVAENPELEEILATMHKTEKIVSAIFLGDTGDDKEGQNFNNELEELEQAFGVGNPELKHKNMDTESSLKGKIVIAIEEGIDTLPKENATDPLAAPQAGNELQSEDLSVEEPIDDLGGEELTVEEPTSTMNVEVTPTPQELIDSAKQGPKWEINNMLSINKAEEYYNQLKKQLEEVAFNPNIKMDLNGISQYDKVRNMIDTEINKIQEAIKGKEKLEKKEEKLEEEVKGPEPEISVEEPTVSTKATETPEGIEEAEPTVEGA